MEGLSPLGLNKCTPQVSLVHFLKTWKATNLKLLRRTRSVQPKETSVAMMIMAVEVAVVVAAAAAAARPAEVMGHLLSSTLSSGWQLDKNCS